MVIPLASALRTSPSTHGSASPKAAIGPVAGLTMPILTARPAARARRANSIGAVSAPAAPAPIVWRTLRRDSWFGCAAIFPPSPEDMAGHRKNKAHFFRRPGPELAPQLTVIPAPPFNQA